MIGLGFLAVGLLWLAFSAFLAIKLPRWLGISKTVWRWVIGAAVLLVLLIGPFVDHIVGMRQFQKLCDEQTRLQVYPSLVNTKHALEYSSEREQLVGAAVPIYTSVSTIIDLDTKEVIGKYKRFATKGGVVGGPMTALEGEHVCSIYASKHVDHQKYLALKSQTNLKYGEAR